MTIQFQKIFIMTIIFILTLLSNNRVFAATLSLTPSKEKVGISEQFYVDLMLSSQEESVNTISGSINYPTENVSFLRAEDGKSMVDLWVEKPKEKNGQINFAGIITGGFDGVIDPFNQDHKLPGLIIRLVFESKESGIVEFSTSSFSLNLNDGKGSEINAPNTFTHINIDNVVNKTTYQNTKKGTPKLEAYVTRDPSIHNNKYILIFNATDKETGIKNVKIKEGRRDWHEIESPYLLKDQSRHSSITLQAMNYSGGGVVVNIDKIPYEIDLIHYVVGIIILIIFIFIIIKIKKIYVKNK
jgi:hypothetical protein